MDKFLIVTIISVLVLAGCSQSKVETQVKPNTPSTANDSISKPSTDSTANQTPTPTTEESDMAEPQVDKSETETTNEQDTAPVAPAPEDRVPVHPSQPSTAEDETPDSNPRTGY